MINLVVGKKNAGKTTQLRELFTSLTEARGFCSEKIHDCGRVTSYILEDLKTGETRVVARLASLPTPEGWGEDIQHGPFRFALSSFEWARELLRDAVESGAKAFFIDELGKLELQGTGHAELIREAMKTGLDLYISIRDINVNPAVKAFGFDDYVRIDVTNDSVN